MTARWPVTVLATLSLMLGACAAAGRPTAISDGSASPPASGSGSPSEAVATPSPRQSAPSSRKPEDPVVVTFSVAGIEEYRIALTDPAQIAIARRLLAGEEAPSIPNGLVLPGDGGVNAPWTWHIDPASLEFADFTMEVCDGLPSDVEAGAISGDRFCPWTAEVVEISEGL